MSADRFQFLEFEGEESPTQEAFGRGVDDAPAARDLHADIMADGTALAEVRVTDPRGYRAYQEDEEDGAVTLSSLAGQAGAVPTRLRAVEVFGERGDRAGQFHYPTGLAVDGDGVLFVADTYHHRIQRITPGGGVAVIGRRGSGRGQFLSPQGIATDEDDAFYVLEQGGGRVQKFTKEGVLTLIFGKPGKGEGELDGPTAIAVAPGSRNIYIADTGNSRVQRFDQTGRFLSFVGGAAGNEIGLSSPQALAAEPGGSLTVADTFAQRLLRFDPLGRLDRQLGGVESRLKLRRSRPVAPSLAFYQPRALAADPSGLLLYVADSGAPDPLTGETRGRVQCVSVSEGRVIATVEKAGRSLGTLLRPGGLAVSPVSDAGRHGSLVHGDLYVADTMNHRILRFAWS